MATSVRQLLLVLTFLAGICAGLYLGAVVREGHAQTAEVEAALRSAAATEHVAYRCLRDIAWAESRFRPLVDNYQGSGAAGLFQFKAGTWRENAPRAGYDRDPAARYQPWPAAHVAAWMIARPWTGALGHWGRGWGRTC